MRKGYLTKSLCLALILVMSISMFPLNVSAAAPNTYSVPQFVLANAKSLMNGRPARLTISDMTFNGKLHNTELNEDEIKKVAEQVMREQGMSDQKLNILQNQIAQMNEAIGFSDADKKQVMDNILTTINAALSAIGGDAAGLIGDVLGILQGAYQLLEGEANEAIYGSVEAIDTKMADKVTNGVVGQAISYAKGGVMLAEEWQRTQKRYAAMRDGLQAVREMKKFFDALEGGLNKFVEQNKKWNYLSFEALTDSSGIPIDQERPFMIYGVQCVEKWTVFMRLNYKAPYSSDLNLIGGHYDGEYEGTYIITIVYDLSNLMYMLPELIRKSEWQIPYVGTPKTQTEFLQKFLKSFVDDDYPGNQKWTLPDSGEWILRRQIKGTATARIKHGYEEIYPAQENDETKYAVPPVAIKMTGRTDGGKGAFWGDDAGFRISVDKEGFYFDLDEDSPKVFTVPFGENIWTRAENAKWNWKLETKLRK